MASFNKVILMGGITRDPELKQSASGVKVADLSLAISEQWKDKSGESQETTCYVDIVVWNRQAELCCQYLTKGRQVLIEGRLQLDKWENSQGEKRSKLRVQASRVQFLSSGKNSAGGGGALGSSSAPAAQPAQNSSAPASPDVDDLGDEDDLPF
ncbi:MAG: single-stranded DNA-binding protein [Kiritimatiellae bacterium]|jgi:single-strand DNA-binding protein|nr:single-stranded DNA-binding protein [Kiritimatiellia bacterium]